MLQSAATLGDARHPKVALWLYAVSALIIFMIVYGGWVRLTRSGLSIVEWNVVTGVLPPLDEAAWQEEFAKYQGTPEYEKINRNISLPSFKEIYSREFTHRLLGRVSGLAYVVPLVFFLVRGAIPRRRLVAYLGIGLLFALQGLVGWLMVKSGLVERPQVSHYHLVAHLGCALALLAAVLWLAFENSLSSAASAAGERNLALGLCLAVVAQIAAGGLVSGLKAGYVSDTYPRMFGEWIPSGLAELSPVWLNLFENPITLHFQHRWLAVVPLALAVLLWIYLRRRGADPVAQLCIGVCLLLITAQIALGIAVVVSHVPPTIASVHQGIAVAIFVVSLLLVFHTRMPQSASSDGQ
jgi:cytochrome c oxidase assembly protein subunit 15